MMQQRLTDKIRNRNPFALEPRYLVTMPGIFVASLNKCWYECRRCNL